MDSLIKAIAAGLIILCTMFGAMLLGPVFGAFGGWFVGLTPVGGWVSTGAQSLGLKMTPADLWALGAFLGFFAPPFRSQLSTKD